MRLTKLLVALFLGSTLACSAALAGDEKADSKPAKCCAKAAKEGKACEHSCCTEAAAAGKNCDKCGGVGTTEAKK